MCAEKSLASVNLKNQRLFLILENTVKRVKKKTNEVVTNDDTGNLTVNGVHGERVYNIGDNQPAGGQCFWNALLKGGVPRGILVEVARRKNMNLIISENNNHFEGGPNLAVDVNEIPNIFKIVNELLKEGGYNETVGYNLDVVQYNSSGQSNRLIMRHSYNTNASNVIDLGLLSDVTSGQCGAHYVLKRTNSREEHVPAVEFESKTQKSSVLKTKQLLPAKIHFFVEQIGFSLEDAYTSGLVSLGVPKEYACYGRIRGNCPKNIKDINTSLKEWGIKCCDNTVTASEKVLYCKTTNKKITDFGVAFGINLKICYFDGMPSADILIDIPPPEKTISKKRLFEKIIAVCQMMNIKLVPVPLELSTETVKSAVCLKKCTSEEMMSIDKASSISIVDLSEILSSHPNVSCVQVKSWTPDVTIGNKSGFCILLYGGKTLEDIVLINSNKIVPLFITKWGKQIDLSTPSPATVPINFSAEKKFEKDACKRKNMLENNASKYPLVAVVDLNDEMISVALDRIANCMKVTTLENLNDYFRVILTNGTASAEFLMSRMNYQVVGMTDNGKWHIDISGGPSYTGAGVNIDITDKLIEEILNETKDSFKFWMNGKSITPYGAFYILAISEAAKSMPTRQKFFRMLYLVKNKIGGARDIYLSEKAKLLRNDWDKMTWSSIEPTVRSVVQRDSAFLTSLYDFISSGRKTQITTTSLQQALTATIDISPLDWTDIMDWSLEQLRQRRDEIIKSENWKSKNVDTKKDHLLNELMNEIQAYIKRSKTTKEQYFRNKKG